MPSSLLSPRAPGQALQVLRAAGRTSPSPLAGHTVPSPGDNLQLQLSLHPRAEMPFPLSILKAAAAAHKKEL